MPTDNPIQSVIRIIANLYEEKIKQLEDEIDKLKERVESK
jgi:hypothetical protein